MVQRLDRVHCFIDTHVEVDHIILIVFCFNERAIPSVLEFVGLHVDLWHGEYHYCGGCYTLEVVLEGSYEVSLP